MNKGKIALLQITPFLYTDNGTLNKENEQRLRDIDECLDELEEVEKSLKARKVIISRLEKIIDEQDEEINNYKSAFKTINKAMEFAKEKDNG